MALTHEALQETLKMGCGNPFCTHDHSKMVMKPRCHPRSPTFAVMTKGSDVLRIECAKCGKLIVEILVASGNPTASLSV